jgi:oxygen-dependent protoporphyrinogen oxidase
VTRRVAIVGGGISGLTAAFAVEQRGYRATVFEAGGRPGGKIRSSEVDGIVVEEGPDAFLPRDDRPIELMRALGLADQIVSPAVFGAYIWCNDGLRRLPPGSPYGIPRSPYEAYRSGLLSPVGAARAALERFSRRPLTGPDVSIGDFVRTRFGTEVAAHMVDPLLAGVRGGRSEHISLAAAAREIDELARSNRSITTALRAAGPPETPHFIAPRGGMVSLVDELVARLGDVRANRAVSRVEVAQGRLRIDGEPEDFDAAIVAAPAFAAAAILGGIDAGAASLLRTIGYASVATVALVHPAGSVRVPSDGSGFLVPTGAGLALSACTWYSAKWPGIGARDRTVMRAVVGRAGDDPILRLDDDALVARVQRDLVTTMGVGAAPVATRVTRWEHSIPQYAVGHLDLVAQIEDRLAAAGPVFITGAGYRGSGIPDCIASAHRAADAVDGSLGGPGG